MRVGRIVATRIDSDAAEFIEEQPFLVVASIDDRGRPWASPVSGPPGLARVQDDVTLLLTGGFDASDPIHENLRRPGPMALLAIDLSTRSRYRVNGVGETIGLGRFRLRVHEAFGNCRKYIQVRHLEPIARSPAARLSDSETLTHDQRGFIESADTFFMATVSEGGADASHRGGRPGFVRIERDGTLVIPDYTGNNMFQSLGNIEITPLAGLLFLDFESGRVVQLTGAASIDWDESHATASAGALRLIRVTPARVLESRDALGVRGALVESSPFNP